MRRVLLFLGIHWALGLGGLSVFCPGCGEPDPNDPNTWIEQLDDPDTRKKAIDQLMGFKGKPGEELAVDGLIKGYETDSDRYEIIVALGQMKNKKAIKLLISALDYKPNLTDKNAAKAAEALGRMKAVEAVSALIPRLEDPNNFVKLAAINALGDIGDKQAAPELIKIMLADPEKQDFFLNKRSAVALGKIADPASTPSIIRAMFIEGRGSNIFREARIAIAKIGNAAQPALLKAFQRQDTELEAEALRFHFQDGAIEAKTAISIGDVGDSFAVPILLGKLMETKFFMRETIAEALAKIGDPQAVEPLTKAMAVGEWNERRAAVKALTYMGDKRAMEPLFECARDAVLTKDEIKFHGLRADCALAITRLGDGGEDLSRYDKMVKAEKISETRKSMVEYQERLVAAKECKTDVACWTKKLDDPNWRVVDRAAHSLLHLKAKSAKAALVAKLGTKDLNVKPTIIQALWDLGDASLAPDVRKVLFQERNKKAYKDIAVDMFCLQRHLEQKK